MKVAILAVNDGALFELGCAVELFGLQRPEFKIWYDSDVVCFDDPQLGYTADVQLHAKRIRKLDAYDMLVVPSWNPSMAPEDGVLSKQVKKFHDEGKRILSFCSGAFLLGYLGLLTNREATTHWRYSEQFQKLFPQTRYVDDVLYIFDGNIGCSAGSAAGLDLGIAVIRTDFGHKIANQVARRLVMPAHRSGGQSQFVETPVLQAPGKFSEALDWCIENLPSIHKVSTVAERARMSRRSFDRKFRSTLGMTPNEWLIEQRVLLAKTLLEESTERMESIAESAGFGSAITMRYHFNQKFGVTPSNYRNQFRAN